MIKPENDKNSSSLLAEGIFYWDLHIVKCYIGSARRGGITCLDLSRLHTRAPLNEDDRKTVLRLPSEI